MTHHNLTRLVQSHLAIELFDYSQVIKWALEQLENNVELENILILASLPENSERQEIRPYLSAALLELNLKEYSKEEAIKQYTIYHCIEILNEDNIRNHIHKLFELYLELEHLEDLMPFYLLQYSWDQLENEGLNYYWEGVSLGNIKSICAEQAKIWLNKNTNINGI